MLHVTVQYFCNYNPFFAPNSEASPNSLVSSWRVLTLSQKFNLPGLDPQDSVKLTIKRVSTFGYTS